MWARDYYVLKTSTGDAVALVQRLCPTGDSSTVNFTLWYPEHEGTGQEFLELVGYSISFEEYITHRDAFKTFKEVDIVKDEYESTSMVREILVRKKEWEDKQ